MAEAGLRCLMIDFKRKRDSPKVLTKNENDDIIRGMTAKKMYDMSASSFFWFRILPGGLTLVLLTSPLWASLLGLYDALLVFLAFTASYILYFSLVNTIGCIVGYSRMKRDTATDWTSMIKKLKFKDLPDRELLPKDLSKLCHLFFIPTVKETYENLHKALSSIANQDYPYMKNVIIVLGQEKRTGPERIPVMNKLKRAFAGKFKAFWVTYHPADIPGEIVGDACSNLRWMAVETTKLLKKNKIDSQYTLFTKGDSDTIYHHKHLCALTYKYLTMPRRNNKFYSPAVILYKNNFWKVPAISRVFTSALTVGICGEWVLRKSIKQSFSCYSSNLALLERINYWDASTGAEDTYFYWNAFLHLDGDFAGEEFYLPITMNCVEGSDYFSSLLGLYKQQIRWGWGAIIMSIAVQGMVKNPHIPINRRFSKFMVLFNAYNFITATAILLLTTVPIMTALIPALRYSAITYLLPRTIGIILTAGLITQIPNKYLLWKYYGGPPADSKLSFKIWWWVFEPLLLFVNLWTYYLLPRLQAQFEILIGKKRMKFLAPEELKK